MNAMIESGLLGTPAAQPAQGAVPLLDIRDLRIEYRNRDETVVAVPGVSLRIAPGESYGLVGESGCGKTTTAMAVMGYMGGTGRVTGGSIRFEGQELVGASAAQWRAIRGRRVAMVYQEPMSALNPVKTIGAQLAEVPRRHLNASRAEARDMCATMLENVRLPDPLAMLKRYPHQLSGGQQQRIVIAMALLARPALLLLDEPTTGLDVTVEAAILDLIADLRKQYGTSLLYISHNLGLIASACDRVGIMYSGEMIEEADTATLFSSPRHPYTQGLLGCIPAISGAKGTRSLAPIPGHLPLPHERPQGCWFGPRCFHFQAQICGGDAIALVPAGAARHHVRCARWQDIDVVRKAALGEAVHSERAQAALVIDDVSKQYAISGSRRVVHANEQVSFEVGKGEIVGLVGESGCGKSSLARMLVGLETATSGSIRFAGTELSQMPAKKRALDMLKSIQMVFQNPDSTLNPSHAVATPIRRALRKFGGQRDKAAIERRLHELLELVRLPVEVAQRLPAQLSGGQKQRIAIARAFATDPSLIVADEPVSALDVSVQAAVITLLLSIQKEQQTTLLFISHDLALVRHVADRIVVMYLGRVMEKGLAEEIFAPPYHPYTEALLSAVHSPDASVQQQRVRLTGETPSPIDVPPGCRFASRCHRKPGDICDTVAPPVRAVSPTHEIACHLGLDELRKVRPVFQLVNAEACN
ncbi:ABC transporter ATP-binding protein [Paraburkholderia sp. SARCC-3016]|uniref:ABC transporter ATP-binding protein n=1 Tax=Paraburkholderia sp. SARCC-3016 TaxID=3058611 RepID=UPI0028077167|nr:ABC transporter ATP-binding protein [Paraburkholderia sp. SARCC-3016]MDQ7982062.1 ABC transporter ATP-binding protein [Paraburkholderia sp. SARCC-3016]